MARSTAARQGCCVALRLGEDNARFLLLFFVMLLYILLGAGIFSLLEHDNEMAQRKDYQSRVRRFLSTYPSVNKSDLDELLEKHNEAATAGFVDEFRTRWDFSGSFHFVSTVVSTIGKQTPAVASLGLVSPGAATDGVTPIFFLKKTDDLFCLSLPLFIDVTRVSPHATERVECSMCTNLGRKFV